MFFPVCLLALSFFVVFSSVQSLSHVRLFATPWITAHQASLSITNSRSSLRLMSIESLMPSSHLIPFSSCPQSLLASGSFPMSQLFAWGGQSIGVSASASFLPMNTQDWCCCFTAVFTFYMIEFVTFSPFVTWILCTIWRDCFFSIRLWVKLVFFFFPRTSGFLFYCFLF